METADDYIEEAEREAPTRRAETRPRAERAADPWAGAPRWMRPAADGDSEMSENLAFLGGGARRGGAGGVGGGGDRERDRDPPPRQSDDTDSFARMFRDSEAGSDSSDARNMSEQHSPMPGARRRGGRARGGGGGGSGGGDGGGMAFDDDDREELRERGMQYQPQPLRLSAVLNGDTLRVRPEAAAAMQADPGPQVAGDAGLHATIARMRAQIEAAEVGVDFDGPPIRRGRDGDDNVGTLGRCVLCRFATQRPEDADPNLWNAYEAMKKLDSQKCGYATEGQVFIEMAVVFNSYQDIVAKAGGESFRLTPEIVRDHFCSHDICNPVRVYARQYRILDEVVGVIADRVIGRTERGAFVSHASLKELNAAQRSLMTFYDKMVLMRSYLNINPDALVMAGPRGAIARVSARHFSGAAQPGKFAGAYLQ